MSANFSRRQFLGQGALAAGAAGLPAFAQGRPSAPITVSRRVTIGTVGITAISADSPREKIEKVLAVMDNIARYQPDIICLPEVFAYSSVPEKSYQLKTAARDAHETVVAPMAAFAAQHRCYVICPTYVLYKDRIYIAAVLIDRKGAVIGQYRKMHPAQNELQMGISAGELKPPVFETDFGKIGIQICFDVKYEEGWSYLKDNGAEIIFWPSAYAGGQEIVSRAWRHQVFITTSTGKDTSRICDITGEALAQTGRWQPDWAVATVNLEKAFILTWPAVSLFPDIQRKYAARIRITNFNEEEWSIIECLDPALRVADVLKEYGLKTAHEFERDLAGMYAKNREGS